MFVINVDELPEEKLYRCNGVVCQWLKEKNFPVLGKSKKTGEFVFSKTELLLEVLETMPFYLRIGKMFS